MSSLYILLGIGNELKGDDGVGCYIARRFKKRDWLSIACDTVPENYIGLIKRDKPKLLVIVDAAYMGLPPGSVRRLKKEHAGSSFMSTHTLPLKEFICAIERYAKEVVLIGIQPKQTVVPDELSMEVRNAAHRVIKVLKHERLSDIEML